MKLSIIIEIGNLGFGWNRSKFDVNPTKRYWKIAAGVIGITIVYGDSTALHAFKI